MEEPLGDETVEEKKEEIVVFEKVKKPRTPAQVEAFLKAKAKRVEVAKFKKEEIEKIKNVKQIPSKEQAHVVKEVKKKAVVAPESDDEEEEEEVVYIKKKKPVAKKRRVIYEEEEEEEEEVQVKPTVLDKPKKDVYIQQQQPQLPVYRLRIV